MAKIKIEVAYAEPAKQHIYVLEVEEGTTIETAIYLSGLLELFSIDLSKQKVGIFGKLRALTDIVEAGDRIEIYRPLVCDPKEARLRRVNRRVNK